jgi:integrase
MTKKSDMEKELMAKNPDYMLQKRARQAERAERAEPTPYTDKEIQAIVDQLPLPDIKDGKPTWEKPSRFWVPLIAMFTGMRKSEIVQLYKSNIAEVDGVLCIKIDTREEGQSLKSPSWRRLVPIHSHLLALGFLEFAGQDGPLFPELKTSGRFELRPSRTSMLLFGSFRRGVVARIRKAEGDRETILRRVAYDLLGRTDPDVSMKSLHKFPTAMLRDAVEKIRYDGVSFDRLKSLTPALP